MTSVFSWQNSVSFCPASFCTLEAKFACYFRYFFCTPVLCNEKDIPFLALVLEGLICLKELFSFSFFSITGRGIDLDYHDIVWFALEMNRDYSVVSETASKHCISDSFVDHDGHSISSEGFLPTVVDIMVI